MEKLNLTGVLVFSGNWGDRPWALSQPDESTIDLYPHIHEMLLEMDGKPAVQNPGLESYALVLDPESEETVAYDPDNSVLLDGKTGVTNLIAYLSYALTRLSGRRVEIMFNDEGLALIADPTEDVFKVWFKEGEDSGRIPEGAEKTICKIGTPDCCIFVGMANGFTCEKFSSLGRHLLARRFHGEMNASRIGNCACAGREN